MKARDGILVLAAALLAAVLGLVASVAVSGPGPLLRTDWGQRLLGQWLDAKAPAGVAVIEPGQAMPRLPLPALQGEVDSVPVAGRITLINYWASWCEPCRREMPILDRYARDQGAAGVQVVGIALDEADDARGFLREQPVGFPILVEAAGPADSSARLGNGLGVLPYSVLIGADGRLLRRRFGDFRSLAELQDWVDEAR
ncbi:TlpA family protein disulfide reductase [Arenimonas oryziterrae]|uniref:Thioredoxin domain-containing protein n=1 Tax=Arenimonas oryziterrae DSM 21050 = YC6267 TaxID=1121015 RepID=A0A091ATF3_9GAMM|nr:TlpA disulfide reductase family protein [Arenimonas oryziterrae]KFN42427.1 hypothetical protein N789_13810 [Arenimonas oryziterrae DSM 21050 = YC6267]